MQTSEAMQGFHFDQKVGVGAEEVLTAGQFQTKSRNFFSALMPLNDFSPPPPLTQKKKLRQGKNTEWWYFRPQLPLPLPSAPSPQIWREKVGAPKA